MDLSEATARHLKEIGLTSDEAVVRKTFVPDLVKADEEKRTATFVISTGAVDRDNDTIKVEGWDVKNYLRNPVVLWAHDSSRPPVGKAVSVVKTAGTLKATVEFVPEGVYDLADTVYQMVKGGFLRATSVGFRPKRDKWSYNEERGGVDFEEQELLEFSVVPVPSNPQALMDQAKDFAGATAAGIDLGPIRKALNIAEQVVPLSRIPSGDDPPPPIQIVVDGKTWARHPVEEKAGRRLSAKTEQSLRSAHKSATEAVEHLNSVLERAEEEMEEGKSAPVLMVTPSEPKSFAVNTEDVKAAVLAAVSATVQAEVNRLRGRLD